MSDKVVKNMIGTLGADPKRPMRDSDGDGVVNILDCKPYNKNKQGFIHNMGAKLARKVGREELAERIEERGERADEIKAARREERQETRIVTVKAQEQERRRFAIQRETIKTDARLKREKERQERGGVISQFVGGFSQPQKAKRTIYAQPKAKKKVVYEKIGGKFVKRTVTSRARTIAVAKPKKRQSLEGFIGKRFGGGF